MFKKKENDENMGYVAFISYKEEDYEWAKWLQHKLEHYHLPIDIRKKNPEYPKIVKPVFEYKSEMSGGYLEKEIAKALDNSASLIVICSPNTPNSEWVAKEVQYFIDSNRADKIIPFIVAGEVSSKDKSKECYPKPLLKIKEEKRGININEMGRDAAAVKVVAQMFGLKFDDLWHRYEKEQKRKRIIIATAILSFALLATSIALWIGHLNGMLTDNYRKLAIENIRMSSNDIVNQINQGSESYLEVKERLNDIIELWKENGFQQQDAPEFEVALRAMYRQKYKDGLIKLYTIPISDKQKFVYADSNYLYIIDSKKEGHDVLIRYKIETGDSAVQIIPLLERNNKFYICDIKGDVIIYRDNIEKGEKTNFFAYNIKSKRGEKIYQDDGNCYLSKVLASDIYLFENGTKDGIKFPYSIVQIKNGQKRVLSITMPFSGSHYLLQGDSLFAINGSQVAVCDIKIGQLKYEIDYRDDKKKDLTEFFYQDFSTINPNTMQFANNRKGYGLRLFSVISHNSIIINNTLPEGSVAINASGKFIAYAKITTDSLFLYNPNYNWPIFKTRDIGIGGSSLLFGGDEFLVADEGSQISVYSVYSDIIPQLIFSPDGKYYVQCSNDNDGTMEIRRDDNDTLIASIDECDKFPCRISFSSNSRYILAATVERLYLFDPKEEKSIYFSAPQDSYSPYTNELQYLISEDENTVLCYNRETKPLLCFYDVKNKKSKMEKRVDREFRQICINADGSKFAISDNEIISIHCTDSTTKELPIDIKGFPNISIRAISFGHSRDSLIVSYSDGSIRLWNTTTKEQIGGTIQCKYGWVSYLDVSKDNQYVVGTVLQGYKRWIHPVWHIPSGQLVDEYTSDWAEYAIPLLMHKDPFYRDFRAIFSRGEQPSIIINDYSNEGLSRKYAFPSFKELIEIFETDKKP